MTDQATILRELINHQQGDVDSIEGERESLPKVARTVAFLSGKGGVGKSNIALNTAVALAEMDHSVCLMDANLGLGNIDLLCGLNGYWNLSHVMTGGRTLSQITLEGPAGVHIIPGAGGLAELSDCPADLQTEMIEQLQHVKTTHDFLLIDTGTGIHRINRKFSQMADDVFLLTTGEPTSIADCYACIKAFSATELKNLQVIVNRTSHSYATTLMTRLQHTSRAFLQMPVLMAACIPEDGAVIEAVKHRKPFLTTDPHGPASRAIRQLAIRLKALRQNQLRTPSKDIPFLSSELAAA